MITQRLIITCEECGEVRHFDTTDEDQAELLFSNFTCPNKCDSAYYSYITIRQISIDANVPSPKLVETT